jgi:aminoglycoside 6'-N-acetyltransferase I
LRPPQYSILDLATADEETIRQAAKVLVEGFEDDWPDARRTEEEALEEVQEVLGKDRICRVALGEDGTVLGWIGGLPSYGSKVWELHPLVVRPDLQRRGIAARSSSTWRPASRSAAP